MEEGELDAPAASTPVTPATSQYLGAGRLAWMTLNIAAGLIVMFAGLASSVEELYSSSSGFFDGECRLEYTYSPESPDDPCFLSGLPHEAGR